MRRFSLLGLLALLACGPEVEPVLPTDRFTKIYDSEQFDAAYRPLDVAQIDNGYVVLAARRLSDSDFYGVSLLHTDLEGTFVGITDLANTYVQPTPGIRPTSAGFQFFCMDRSTLQSYVVTVDPATGTPSEPVAVGGLNYPLAIGLSTNQNLLLLSYSPANQNSVISEVSPDGSVIRSQGFSIGAGNDVEGAIVNHFTREDSQLPFFVGQSEEGTYYFNGFYNYTLSMVFTDLNSNTPRGVLQGQQTSAGLFAARSLGNEVYAIATFNFNQRYIQSRVDLNETSVSSTVNYEANPVPEMDLASKVRISRVQFDDPHLIYGCHTRDRQIALYAYRESDGALVGTRYLGFGLPYSFSSMRETVDGGLIITGSVYVADRFERIALIKLSENDKRELLGTLPVLPD